MFVHSPCEHKATCPGRQNPRKTFFLLRSWGHDPHSSLEVDVDLLTESQARVRGLSSDPEQVALQLCTA